MYPLDNVTNANTENLNCIGKMALVREDSFSRDSSDLKYFPINNLMVII